MKGNGVVQELKPMVPAKRFARVDRRFPGTHGAMPAQHGQEGAEEEKSDG